MSTVPCGTRGTVARGHDRPYRLHLSGQARQAERSTMMLAKSECLNLLQRLANHLGHVEKIFTDLPPLMRYGRPAVDEGL